MIIRNADGDPWCMNQKKCEFSSSASKHLFLLFGHPLHQLNDARQVIAHFLLPAVGGQELQNRGHTLVIFSRELHDKGP